MVLLHLEHHACQPGSLAAASSLHGFMQTPALQACNKSSGSMLMMQTRWQQAGSCTSSVVAMRTTLWQLRTACSPLWVSVRSLSPDSKLLHPSQQAQSAAAADCIQLWVLPWLPSALCSMPAAGSCTLLSTALHGCIATGSPTSLSSDVQPHRDADAVRPRCIFSDTECVCAGTDNAGHFFVGTQDRQLRGHLGGLPAGPVLFVAADGLHLEQPTPQQQRWAEQVGMHPSRHAARHGI